MGTKTVILTRSEEGNAELSARLRELGFSPVALDTLRFSPPADWSRVDSLLRRLVSFDWLVFTSATGVRFFGQRASHQGLSMPWRGKPKVAAVGPKTAAALATLGLKAEFLPGSFRTSAVAEELPTTLGKKVLLLRADIADKALVDRLKERGFVVEATSVYVSHTPRVRKPRNLGFARFVVFASPSAVKGLCSQLNPEELAKLQRAKAVCIGPVTEAAAKEHGFIDTVFPRVYTLEAVIGELARLGRGRG